MVKSLSQITGFVPAKGDTFDGPHQQASFRAHGGKPEVQSFEAPVKIGYVPGAEVHSLVGPGSLEQIMPQ